MTTTQIRIDSYRRQPRRRFTQPFKAQVVEQLLADGTLTVAQVAREHDIHPNLLCRWRREYHQAQLPQAEHAQDRGQPCPMVELLPVNITTALQTRDQEPLRTEPFSDTVNQAAGAVALRVTLVAGTIEIMQGCEPTLLRTVLQVLR